MNITCSDTFNVTSLDEETSTRRGGREKMVGNALNAF